MSSRTPETIRPPFEDIQVKVPGRAPVILVTKERQEEIRREVEQIMAGRREPGFGLLETLFVLVENSISGKSETAEKYLEDLESYYKFPPPKP